MAFIAWPELYPDAAFPCMLIERAPLKRLICVGPVVSFGFRSVSSGTISPAELRTKMNFAASASVRYGVADWSTTL